MHSPAKRSQLGGNSLNCLKMLPGGILKKLWPSLEFWTQFLALHYCLERN